MNPTHNPYAHILRAIADGLDIQFRWMNGDYGDVRAEDVLKAIGEGKAARPEDFRVKPPTIKINGYSVPAPLRVEPAPWADYWRVDLVWLSDNALPRSWDGSKEAKKALEHGLIHLTREAATKHATALLSFTTSK
jgi:hypothetical protein